jgi:CelD/BcsL family acetyltransferase involved in cellulose biosynthesis
VTAAALMSAREVAAVEPAWRARQACAWTADPAASWEWIAAGIADVPSDREYLLLGSLTRPVGVLETVAIPGRRFARPLGRGLDRLAWCPGATREETRSALEAGRRLANLWLPSLECERTSDWIRAHAASVHGEFLTVEDYTDWDTYLASRPKSLRKTLRGAVNRSNRGHSVEITRLAPGATASRIDELREVESRGHRAHGRLLQPSRGQHISFTARLISSLDTEGRVRTFAAYDSGILSAYLVGLTAGRRFLAYTMAVRSSCRDLALGHRLFAEAIRVSIDDGEAIDLGNGTSDFKRRWATSTHQLQDLFIGSPSLEAVARVALTTRRHMGAWIDQWSARSSRPTGRAGGRR